MFGLNSGVALAAVVGPFYDRPLIDLPSPPSDQSKSLSRRAVADGAVFGMRREGESMIRQLVFFLAVPYATVWHGGASG